MATYYKVLGQVAPSATTNTTGYTVPAGTDAVISTISICNRGATDATYRIAIRPNGASIADEHYIVYDAPVVATNLVALTLGLTCNAADVVTVYASNANLSFGIFGSEIA